MLYISFNREIKNLYFYAGVVDVVMTFLRNGIAYVYLIYMIINKKLDVLMFILYFSAVEGFSNWLTGILKDLNILNKQSLVRNKCNS